MTPKQKRFVQEYLIDLNATQAAIRAGYSTKTAYSIGEENLRKPDVAKAIEEAQAERGERTEVSQDWVIDSLRAVHARCTQEGEFNAAGANRALELIGKHLGMFVDRVKVSMISHEDALRELE